MSFKNEDGLYELPYTIAYESPRYGKSIIVPKGYISDGATGALDIASEAWWVHDLICERGTWEDGTPITAWQAATVLHDILLSEGRWARARYWRLSTFAFGCKKTRENGWW